MEWMILPLKRYAEFSGRSRRKEYWMYFLFTIIVGIVLGGIDGILGLNAGLGRTGVLGGLFSLATLIPSIAVAIRRLHDTDRSGWWLLLVFIPILGWIALLVFYCTEGTRGPNAFGPDPKAENLGDVFA